MEVDPQRANKSYQCQAVAYTKFREAFIFTDPVLPIHIYMDEY